MTPSLVTLNQPPVTVSQSPVALSQPPVTLSLSKGGAS